MTQTAESLSDTELLHELRTQVDLVVTSLSARDAELARTLVSLLTHFHRLSLLSPFSSSTSSSQTRVASWNVGTDSRSHTDPYSTLRRQVSDFQLERSSQNRLPSTSELTPTLSVESSLLWSLIDDELESVLSLCRSQHHDADPFADNLPPEYDAADYEQDSLPSYEANEFSDIDLDGKKGGGLERTSTRLSDNTSEKMKMDLEAVTLAIDRLYLVAPQLHNQRVELKKSKLERMENAKRKGKQREDETHLHELDRIVELIGKASDRKMSNQAVYLDGDEMRRRLVRAREKELEQRTAFVEHLVKHSDAGRLHSQDAAFSTTRARSHPNLAAEIMDPHAMLTLPEFIRETIPEGIRRRMELERDPEALLTLPEFIKEHPSPEPVGSSSIRHARGLSVSCTNGSSRSRDENSSPTPSPATTKAIKGSRSRSMSEPLSWLLPKSSSPTQSLGRKTSGKKLPRQSSAVEVVPEMQETLDVTYVAEYHENLQHILIFLTVSGLQAGVELEAEVVSPESGPDSHHAQLLLRCGASTSQRLALPAPVAVGPAQVNVVGGRHFQVKLAVIPPASPQSQAFDTDAELDATHFQHIQPTSFICASCSLPLVRGSALHRYRDLPSEHWAELVDAWMCHADQKLHEHVQKGSKEGFWPADNEALVGGSYLLLRENAVVKVNLCGVQGLDANKVDDWSRVRCICGAVVGRSQEHKPKYGESTIVYRLAKYAIRPVSPTAEPSRIPLSAFIVEDMYEYVHAHATYRFVIVDEEEDKPRILVWLFKPSMRIAYATPRQFVIPRHGSIRGAKVLYKLIGPSVATSEMHSMLQKYPGFPQAEHLYYPFQICQRLAATLKESTTAYPESMRTMTGLDVGWLQRA
ncbi:uncharacterized protein PHACADRAFT_251147 [Phanerochaete carnosa HHB-10118-sp]|uniref:HECT-like ubiquitin-conjugating enzyme-binding-domain-containing protein n=1 Tax=Phanerochaete carnosa (strain HHB-10118-sp) TaxID=650164 RepID=K5W0X4_PHACS|nr:uncharacterized protein PHACADRAFT_251147 [Phanerochaete carnosa HHB-10118-sp]EKM57478.1 hypothetical protein PHACADRAFT_251147 [Phanerochaete carnosa HHB-10118-sp]